MEWVVVHIDFVLDMYFMLFAFHVGDLNRSVVNVLTGFLVIVTSTAYHCRYAVEHYKSESVRLLAGSSEGVYGSIFT